METLYYFQYVAWHFLPPIARWTQQPGKVKRRYREFVTLQDRLEEHPKYRKSIKGSVNVYYIECILHLQRFDRIFIRSGYKCL